MKSFRILLLASLVVLFNACGNGDDCCVLPPSSTGYFVVNEGGFGNGNTSLSFYDDEEKVMYNNVFAAANGRDLGDQSQSMALHNDLGYIVVQNSGKVEVINPETYVSVATITEGIENPRYFLGIDESKGYLSDWGLDGVTGTVKVIDLQTMTVTSTIPTGSGANRMLKSGNSVYVTNNGGFGRDNTVKILDVTSNEATGTIEVGDNPNSLAEDSSGALWILCAGHLAYNPDFSIDEANSTTGSLVKVENDQVVNSLEIPGFTYSTANNLNISPDGMLYFTFNGKVWAVNSSAPAMPSEPFLDLSLYGLGIDPDTGHIFGCEAPDFSSSGNIIEFDQQGNVIQTLSAGIAPNGMVFK